MREDAPELGRIAFHLDQCAAEYGFLLSLGQRLLEQATKAVLLPLDPQEILNLLPHSTLVERRSRFARANKPKALSTSTKCGDANVDDVARSACSFVKQNSTCIPSAELGHQRALS